MSGEATLTLVAAISLIAGGAIGVIYAIWAICGPELDALERFVRDVEEGNP